jgi:hypothetical protein
LNFEGIVGIDHDARGVQRGSRSVEQLSCAITATLREGKGGVVEVSHGEIVRIISAAQLRAFSEAARGALDVAPVNLNVSDIMQLHRDHPTVAEAPVERQALRIKPEGLIGISGKARAGGKQVQWRDIGRRFQISC